MLNRKSDLPEQVEKITPSMAQYIEIKAANPDCLLFYRMGDFYELFFEDAEIASRALGIVLTKRGKHSGQDIPMCGVPVVRADDYLQRLIALGHRVAVCEQLEDPAEARKRGSKAVVRRDVVRLVTPGTVTEEALLDPGRPSLFLAIARSREEAGWHYGIASIDITTGRFGLSSCIGENELAAEFARLDAKEVVVPDTLFDDPALKALWRESGPAIVPIARDGFDPSAAERRLIAHFGVRSLDAFGDFSRAEAAAAAAALAYVEKTQIGARPALSPPQRSSVETTMRIDAATRANLELVRTLSGERTGSVLSVIDRSVTPGGARLLAERLAGPLVDRQLIEERLDAVSFLVEEPDLREEIRSRLKHAPDGARALSRLALQRGGPRDLAALRDMIRAGLALAELIGDRVGLPIELARACGELSGLDAGLAHRLDQALGEELPLQKRDGGFVRDGFEPALDEARELRDQSRRYIAGLQARYAEETGVRTLRIKHNNFLGYYVEVAQAAGETFLKPPHQALFIHRQTMAGAMRFSTPELGELEQKIASAGERALALELAVFEDLSTACISVGEAIKRAAMALSVIDVAAGLATLADDLDWTRPQTENTQTFTVEGGRHPVVEQALKRAGEPFVANAITLDPPQGEASGRIVVMTGPNMAGKSTYLRQAALIAILAQMGSFVPARRAAIGLVDRLFSRVGAADDLARGRSTFMVEMIETATILNQATARSLVILDEIGRGTATFDGLSIAWATIEHLHERNRCRALFATHFHELTQLSRKLPRLTNITMRVAEHQGEVIFLHEVVPGAADRSYGIQVAKLAGLPGSVVERAKVLLRELETSERNKPVSTLIDDLPLFATPAAAQPAETFSKHDDLREALDAIDPDALTPRQALDALYALKKTRSAEQS